MSDKNRDEALLTNEVLQFSEKLKMTREHMGMSVPDAASRLNLSSSFITMLENENLLHSSLPRIYLRGYLRSYIRILNIPADELAPILEILDPAPIVISEPESSSSKSLSPTLSFEINPYYARLASVFITLGLLISITTWWYSHTNSSNSTVVALNQPTVQDTSMTSANTEIAPSAPATTSPLPLSNNTALQTAANSPEVKQSEMPAASIDLAKKPLTLASSTDSAKATPAKPEVQTKAVQEDGDDDADDQE